MMNIAIIGPSGAGKGTHATSLSTHFELHQISTGDLFRENLRSHSALGLVARKYMERGELVPDELVAAMIEEWCYRLPASEGALFDGFPRTIDQVRFLDGQLHRIGRQLDGVVYLQVPDDEIAQRLAGRLICRRCQTPYHQRLNPPARGGFCDRCGSALYHRPDDLPEMVRTRLRVYHRATDPVIDHYSAAGKLLIVSGMGAIADVDTRLVEKLSGLRDGAARFATPAERDQLPHAPASAMLPEQLTRKTLDIVLLGAPGSGKSTQAEALSQRLQLPRIAAGDLFRENLRLATELGKLAQIYMERGELVPIGVTDAMVADRLSQPDAQAGFILDGYPRTVHQAHALMELMGRLQRGLTAVLHVNLADEEIIQRLSGRLICHDCQSSYHATFTPSKRPGVCDRCGGELHQREDDAPAMVRARLATFHVQSEPLIEFYRDIGLLREIEGTDDVATIRERCLVALSRITLLPKVPAGEDI